MEVIVFFAAFGFGIWIGWRLLDIFAVAPRVARFFIRLAVCASMARVYGERRLLLGLRGW